MAAVLFVLLPIQTAPLLMTLVKKGVLRQAGWHLWYTLALAATYAMVVATTTAGGDHGGALATSPLTWARTAGLVATFGVLRLALNVNKYVLWTAVGAVIAAAFRRASA
jgi:hypothetical protein